MKKSKIWDKVCLIFTGIIVCGMVIPWLVYEPTKEFIDNNIFWIVGILVFPIGLYVERIKEAQRQEQLELLRKIADKKDTPN